MLYCISTLLSLAFSGNYIIHSFNKKMIFLIKLNLQRHNAKFSKLRKGCAKR